MMIEDGITAKEAADLCRMALSRTGEVAFVVGWDSDPPHHYIARLFENGGAPHGALVGDTLEDLRAKMPPGFVRDAASPEELKEGLIEIWITPAGRPILH